jgi:hypothetical protein
MVTDLDDVIDRLLIGRHRPLYRTTPGIRLRETISLRAVRDASPGEKAVTFRYWSRLLSAPGHSRK